MHVAVAEDGVFRNSLGRLLTDSGISVTILASTGEELLARLDPADLPDLALLDIRMPPTHTDEGLVTAERLRERHPSVAILLFSTFTEVPIAKRLLALDGPAGLGYLSKDRVADVELAGYVRRIVDGERVLDNELVTRMFRQRRSAATLQKLTVRERDVLRLMAEGRTNQAIADELVLSPRTVEDYVNAVFTKLDIPGSRDTNRRVLAVLEWFRLQGIDGG